MRRIASSWLALLFGMAVQSTTPAAEPPAPGPAAAENSVPVILDTDVGDDIDDAFALAVALEDPRLEVIGITTAWGDTRTRTLLVRRLLATLAELRIIRYQPSLSFKLKSWPKMYRSPTLEPEQIDDLYSELVCIPW